MGSKLYNPSLCSNKMQFGVIIYVAYRQPLPQGFSIFLGGKAPGTRLAYGYPS